MESGYLTLLRILLFSLYIKENQLTEYMLSKKIPAKLYFSILSVYSFISSAFMVNLDTQFSKGTISSIKKTGTFA